MGYRSMMLWSPSSFSSSLSLLPGKPNSSYDHLQATCPFTFLLIFAGPKPWVTLEFFLSLSRNYQEHSSQPSTLNSSLASTLFLGQPHLYNHKHGCLTAGVILLLLSFKHQRLPQIMRLSKRSLPTPLLLIAASSPECFLVAISWALWSSIEPGRCFASPSHTLLAGKAGIPTLFLTNGVCSDHLCLVSSQVSFHLGIWQRGHYIFKSKILINSTNTQNSLLNLPAF